MALGRALLSSQYWPLVTPALELCLWPSAAFESSRSISSAASLGVPSSQFAMVEDRSPKPIHGKGTTATSLLFLLAMDVSAMLLLTSNL